MANIQFTIEKCLEALDMFARADLFQEAYWYGKALKLWLKETGLEKIDPPMYKQFEEIAVKMDFLSLNMIEDWETVYDLIRNHYEESAKLENYRLWDKLKVGLSAIYILDDRDVIKKKVKKILEDNDRIIINRERYRNVAGMPIKVNEWIKDFAANLGIGRYESIKKAAYLTRGAFIIKLSPEDKEKIKNLLDLYENVSLPSTTKEGYEDDVPVDLGNGKVGIFSRGNVEEIDPKIIEQIKSIKMGDEEEQEEPREKPDAKESLKKLASQYAEGSLERRAIEEEIRKIDNGISR